MRRIRRALPEDAPTVAGIGAGLFRQSYGDVMPDEEIRTYVADNFAVDRVARQLSDPAIATLLALDGETAVAFAQVRRNPAPAESTADADVELWRIYVDRAHHGKGLAQELMSQVFDAARQFTRGNIWLSVWENNPRAIAFYEKLGFRHAGYHDFPVGDTNYRDAVMVRVVDTYRT